MRGIYDDGPGLDDNFLKSYRNSLLNQYIHHVVVLETNFAELTQGTGIY